MRKHNTFSYLLLICLLSAYAWAGEGPAGKPGATPAGMLRWFLLDTVSESKPLPNGFELRSGPALMQVVALRDDVLRVRISPGGELPENASWAVLPQALEHAITVSHEATADKIGFRTGSLRVELERATMRLRILDLNGEVLQEDAKGWPVEIRDNGFRIYKQMPDDEHYFGLGDKPGPLDRRGRSFSMWATDAYRFQESTDPIYKSIPFFLAVRHGHAIGVLLDNTWRTSFDFGQVNQGVYSFGAGDGPIDYYILYGPGPKQVLRAYAWLTGPVPLPPLWALGYQQSRFSYETEARLREVADRFRSAKIPADVLYLDIDFQNQKRPFTVDSETFPHFTRMLADLKQQNFHVVAITDLHIAKAENAGYSPYETGLKGDHFLKNRNGSLYVGEVWPGPSVFPDFTRRATREWWGTLYRQFVADGVAGFWNDMNEPSVFKTPGGTMPGDVRHRIDEPGFHAREASHLEIHNIYGMQNSRATYEGLQKLAPEQRPFVLTRASYAGGQRYAATWTGDNSSTWNHLRLATPMLLNLGLSGFGLSGADVGGFIGTPSPDLLTRWIELATFQPIDRNHAEKGTGNKEPWVHGAAHENIRRRYIEERYRLLPYLYTAAEEMSRTGVPILRPLFLEFPNATSDAHPLDLDAGNEFLFGPDLLVAPAPYPDRVDSYQVQLPPGDWYDYWTGQHIEPGRGPDGTTSVTVQPSLDSLPVYVREGSIIPAQPVTQSTAEIPQGPMTLRVYPGRDCRGSLYADDGTTMAYTRGEFLRMQFACQASPRGVKLNVSARQGNYAAWWKQLKIEIYGWNSGSAKALLNGQPLLDAIMSDPNARSVSVIIPDSGKGATLDVLAGDGGR
jgi:alpha-glucosidase